MIFVNFVISSCTLWLSFFTTKHSKFFLKGHKETGILSSSRTHKSLLIPIVTLSLSKCEFSKLFTAYCLLPNNKLQTANRRLTTSIVNYSFLILNFAKQNASLYTHLQERGWLVGGLKMASVFPGLILFITNLC